MLVNNICFKAQFLSFFTRGGGGLVSESDAWGKLEKLFGRIYVPHHADGCVIQELHKMAMDRDAVFLMVIVGIPGAGKTQLLKELIAGLNPTNFPPDFKNKIKAINDAFEFRDVGELKPGNRKQTSKRTVWVTSSIDKFLGPGIEAEAALKTLEEKLGRCLKKEGRESVIICGNVGALGDIKNERAKSIEGIFDFINVRNYFKAKFIRVPSNKRFFWSKQFGIELDDPFQMSGGWESFQKYSIALIDLATKYLEKCVKNSNAAKCKKCPAAQYLNYIKELKALLLKKDFIIRLHDLLQFLWLKHPDFFLTARTVNVLWGNTLAELWSLVKKTGGTKELNQPLIYQALYKSRVPSTYNPREYSLEETEIHRFRDDDFETGLLKQSLSVHDVDCRLRLRLKYFFETDEQYRSKIGSGGYQDFVGKEKLASTMTEIAEKLALMRVDESLIYSPEKSTFGATWRLEELLLSAKVIARKQKSELGRPLIILDQTLGIISLGRPIFREVQDSSYYLAHREKILELNIKSEKKLAGKPPCLHIGLNDFIVLMSLISVIGQPDFSLYPSTELKINAFFNAIDDIVRYLIEPDLHKSILDRITRNDRYGLRIRTLEPVEDCDIQIENKKLKIKYKEEIVYEYALPNIV